jgi:hypothetical protein
MATLLAVIRPGEHRTQRCDARCYDAHEADCECVCSGMNHGKGLVVARENTRRLHWLWVANTRAKDPDIDSIEIDLEAQNAALF